MSARVLDRVAAEALHRHCLRPVSSLRSGRVERHEAHVRRLNARVTRSRQHALVAALSVRLRLSPVVRVACTQTVQ